MLSTNRLLLPALIAAASSVSFANEEKIEEVIIIANKTSYANNIVSDEMIQQQTAITSVLAVIDNVPGVLINEGDVFGSDDWSTTISMRGFQVSLDEQQIGMTVDGIPNGNSNYGGGSKANRFVDTLNLQTVEVSQGTADISSRSHEALGGTLNFVTADPEEQERMRFHMTNGEYDAKKYYARYDSGELFGNTYAYVSLSVQDNKAWIDESGETNRENFAVKAVSNQSWAKVTGYLTYDQIHEDNYQRVSVDAFKQNPDWDRLTSDWVGSPFVDQNYRRGWSTLRENTLGYVRLDFDFGDVQLNASPYFHKNEGRGDWLPQYVADVVEEGTESDGVTPLPEVEVVNPQDRPYTGEKIRNIYFVDAKGIALEPTYGCKPDQNFPYLDFSDTDGDGIPDTALHNENCYPEGAIPVGSYRHTHYEKERFGLTSDITWTTDVGFGDNVLRGGIWYEDQTRTESRDWHKVIDSRSSYHFDEVPYWLQYSRDYPQTTIMLYVEDKLTYGDFEFRLGGKQWYVDIDREDKIIGSAGNTSLSSDSDLLTSAGVLWNLNEKIDLFAGYAQNFAAIKDVVLEDADLEKNPDAVSGLSPETADNYDIGVRYENDLIQATFTYYLVEFSDRITYIPAEGINGIDYASEGDGEYINVGGIESKGVESSLTWLINENLQAYVSYTYNDSAYSDDFVFRGAVIPEGNTVFGSAEHMWVTSLDWTKGNYSAGLSNKHVGERWIDPLNKNRIDAYDVADFYVAVNGEEVGETLKGYELRFTVNNIFDEDYIGGVAGGWGGWIGGGRTAAFSITADF